MELLKDYDCEILYHPGKSNVVADALSRKEAMNCASVIVGSLNLKKERLGMEFSIQKKDKSLLYQIKVNSMLLERIMSSDERLKEILDNSNSELGKKDFRKGNDDIVRFHDRISLPSHIEIKKEILSNTHSSPFSLHLGSTKMYKELKQHFW